MDKFDISASQTPGVVRFDNYDELKAGLINYVKSFEGVDYDNLGIKVAEEDRDELKHRKDEITKVKKSLKEAYSKPYLEVEEKLDELASILDEPYKYAKNYVDEAEKDQKIRDIMAYAESKSSVLGDAGKRIISSPVFFNPKWLNKGYKPKNYQDDIDAIISAASRELESIRISAGDKASVLLARYYETLSMDGVKSFMETLTSDLETSDVSAVVSEKNAVGYKVLKVTATEDQMAALLDQMELMGLEVEELEDGMPKPMNELTEPSFESFVAFDIETTGTNGAANGDEEAKITEIGAVRVVNGEVVDTFDELANPGRKIVPRISRLTHITDDMLADKPPIDEIIRKFKEFVGDSILVGHNIKSSDLRYIVKAADKAGVNFDNEFLDTYILAKRFKNSKGCEKVNLGYLADRYGFEHKEVHRAWSDAEVNAQVYFELKKLSGV